MNEQKYIPDDNLPHCSMCGTWLEKTGDCEICGTHYHRYAKAFAFRTANSCLSCYQDALKNCIPGVCDFFRAVMRYPAEYDRAIAATDFTTALLALCCPWLLIF